MYDPNTNAYSEYPGIGMHVEVRSPEDKMILSKMYTSEGKVAFTSNMPGEHSICLFSNSTRWFAGSELVQSFEHEYAFKMSWMWFGFQRVHFDIQTGEHAQDYALIATKEKLSELQLRIRQLLDQVEQITKEQNYQRVYKLAN